MSSFYNKKLAISSSQDKPIPVNVESNNERSIIKRKLFKSFRTNRNEFCPDCKEKGIVICDTSEGTQICNACGLVVESHILSEEQEWRNFSNDGQPKSIDRNRVGEISDIWLENNITSTTFIKSSKKLQHLNMMTQINKNDQTLLSAFNILKLICETFYLRSNVIERAKEITKELQEMEQLKNRINNLNMLAVVYLACREAGHIKSIKELITFDRSYKEKDLGKTINKLKKVLPTRAFVYNENISHLIYSLSNRLQLSVELIEAIEYVVKKATTLITTSHRLNSLCGGSIHLIVELNTTEENNVKLPNLSQIASVCGVTTNTLKTTFKELLNAATYILPKCYLKDNSVKLSLLKHKYLSDEKKKKLK
ncbi:transcription initiation factor TFIIB, putative [Plasmodium malariae]|uniref:General transcription factor TFIIB n=1 Tax=Plasmodium malariae TaxID=5858 RepID=A0A1D3JKY8_PLAMA|nr:transcription initiation factor TFIIB, putative [Plasmodium malariae]SBT87087.1 transcription initiation factor TFIIB, putative [Plasmodium malariae]